jgi:hypothetical protein
MDVVTVHPAPEQIEVTAMDCHMAGYVRRNCHLERPHGGTRSTTRVTMGATSRYQRASLQRRPPRFLLHQL